MNHKRLLKLTSLLSVLIMLFFGALYINCNFENPSPMPTPPTQEPTPTPEGYPTPTPSGVLTDTQWTLQKIDNDHHHLALTNPYTEQKQTVAVQGSSIHPILELVQFKGIVRDDGQGGTILDFNDADFTLGDYTINFFADLTLDKNSQLKGLIGMYADIMGFTLSLSVPFDESKADYPGTIEIAGLLNADIYLNDENTTLDIAGENGVVLDGKLVMQDMAGFESEDPLEINLNATIFLTALLGMGNPPAGKDVINLDMDLEGELGLMLGNILDLLLPLLLGEEEPPPGELDISAILEGLNLDKISAAIGILEKAEISLVGDLEQLEATVNNLKFSIEIDIPEGEPLVTIETPLELPEDLLGAELIIQYVEVLLENGLVVYLADALNLDVAIDLSDGAEVPFDIQGLETLDIKISDSSKEAQSSLGLSLIASIAGINIPLIYDPNNTDCWSDPDPAIPCDTDGNALGTPFQANNIPLAGIYRDPNDYESFLVDESGTILPEISADVEILGEDINIVLTIDIGIILPLSTGETTENVSIPLHLELPLSLSGLSLDLY